MLTASPPLAIVLSPSPLQSASSQLAVGASGARGGRPPLPAAVPPNGLDLRADCSPLTMNTLGQGGATVCGPVSRGNFCSALLGSEFGGR